MPEEGPGLKQEIISGDSNQNYQAGRDVRLNVHTHVAFPPAQSLIQRPTNAQIARFDSKTAEILRILGSGGVGCSYAAEPVGRRLRRYYDEYFLRIIIIVVTLDELVHTHALALGAWFRTAAAWFRMAFNMVGL